MTTPITKYRKREERMKIELTNERKEGKSMSDYLKELEKGCGNKINIYNCNKDLHCLNCSNKIASYKQGCKDKEDKILEFIKKNPMEFVSSISFFKIFDGIKELSGEKP